MIRKTRLPAGVENLLVKILFISVLALGFHAEFMVGFILTIALLVLNRHLPFFLDILPKRHQ